MEKEIVYELREKVNEKGFYCKLKFTYIQNDSQNLLIEYDADKRWESASKFAIEYFYGKYSAFKKNGLTISVKNIDSQIIDTNDIVVFYTVVKALCKELDINVGVAINTNGDIVIAK